MMGLGVFAMTRKHMLGVKERAEAASTNGSGVRPAMWQNRYARPDLA